MAEYGIGNGLYEPYSEKLKPSLIPALSEIYDKISNILTYVNLFNSETSVPGYVSASGALVLNNGFDVISDYIPLKSGQIISFSSGVRVSGSYGVNTYDANKQLINTSQYNGVSFTQGVDKSEFIKLSVDNTKLSTTMVNYGAELLPFEPYRAEISTSLLNKVYEYINSLIDSTDAEIISIEKNLFDKNSTVSPAFIEAAGNGSLSTYNPEFEVSDYIRLEEGQKLAVSGSVRLKSPFGIYTYDQNKNWIGVHQEQGDTITGRPGSSFVRVSVEIAKRDQMQVEYGDYPTAYQAYKRSLSPQYIPSYLNNNMRVVLPKKMYMKSNFTPSIYFDNITYSAQNAVKNIAFSKGTHLKNQWNFYDKKVGVIEPVSVVYKGEDLDNIIDSVSISVENVDIFVNAGKSINLLCVGDSFTDIGTWVKETKLLLESDGVLVNLIGTKGGAAAASESLSGGTMSKFLLNKYDTARVCTVSGIVSQPVTAYPGTKYIDGNGTEWTVCGTSLSNGAGRITLTYSGGGEPPVELPSSGVLTKSNTQQGDNSITYTSFTTANRNPFWNPGSSVALDFNYYCDFWGFPAPDILVLQFTYNDIASNVKNVAPTVLAAKQVIDAFHAQYPLAKVVFSIEPCGAKDNSYRLTDATNKAFLQFVEAMVLQFEDDAAYNSFVILAPSYAFVDRVNGYGPSSIIPNSRYPSIIEVYGGDGIHCNTAGMKQIADCVVPVIHKLLTI
jgi:lysophospholipase L1-like esterase